MKPELKSQPLPVACFAPPLTDELLAKYRVLAVGTADVEVRDAMLDLLACCEKWWNLPESTKAGRKIALKHRGKSIEVQEAVLTQELIDQLFDVTPWMRELATLSTPADTGLFDRLPAGELRDAAFHLLWFAKELTLDREPMTQDKLPS